MSAKKESSDNEENSDDDTDELIFLWERLPRYLEDIENKRAKFDHNSKNF